MLVPRKLPIVIVGNEACFFDSRLKQVRKVTNPNSFVDLSEGDLEAILYQLERGVYEFGRSLFAM